MYFKNELHHWNGFLAVAFFLDDHWNKTKDPCLGDLLGSLGAIWAGVMPISTDMLDDWNEITKKDDHITLEKCTSYMIEYLKLHEERTEITHIIRLFEKDFAEKKGVWHMWKERFDFLCSIVK